MTDPKRGDELLTGGTEDATGLNKELEDKLHAAYMAGYRARELDVRADEKETLAVAQRKFERWVARRPWRDHE